MEDTKKIYNELLRIVADAEVMKASHERLIERCNNLKKKLQGSSLPGSKNKGLTPEQKQQVLSRRRKNMMRKVS